MGGVLNPILNLKMSIEQNTKSIMAKQLISNVSITYIDKRFQYVSLTRIKSSSSNNHVKHVRYNPVKFRRQ